MSLSDDAELVYVAVSTELRSSHVEFLENRNWSIIRSFWQRLNNLTRCHQLPSFVIGSNSKYSVTDLGVIHESGHHEFSSKDPRYKRQTFALRISYDGSQYSGYQMQRGQDLRTVEDDIFEALLQRTCVAAGRTDKGVSAISQIISFTTFDDITSSEILETFNNSPGCRQGRLRAWECQRVPRKFQALFSASWRRYLYLFPLNTGDYANNVDVDVEFVHNCFNRLHGLELPYDNFAYRETRCTGTGSSDICTLYHTSASIVSLPGIVTATLFIEEDNEVMVMCVELVGSRFLRRMVRILMATAIRESVLASHTRNDNVLIDICLTGRRNDASFAAPSEGLALAGVGYDIATLVSVTDEESNNAKKKRLKKRGREGDQLEKDKDREDDRELVSGSALPNAQPDPPTPNKDTLDTSFWKSFQSQLVSVDNSKQFFPERAFDFSRSGSFIVNQDAGDVGTIVWDSEVILAHILDKNLNSSDRVLELGAGTALAAAVCSRIGAQVAIQELPHVIPHSLQVLVRCGVNIEDVFVLSGKWGALELAHEYDTVVMADVLYHTEDFVLLIDTIHRAAAPSHATVWIVVEQRRKVLDGFVDSMLTYFQLEQTINLAIPEESGARVTVFHVWKFVR